MSSKEILIFKTKRNSQLWNRCLIKIGTLDPKGIKRNSIFRQYFTNTEFKLTADLELSGR